MIINEDAKVINKFEASLTDDARVVIYDRHMFIVQAKGFFRISFFLEMISSDADRCCKTLYRTSLFHHSTNDSYFHPSSKKAWCLCHKNNYVHK